MNFIDSLTEALFGGAAQASPMGLGAPPPLAAPPRPAASGAEMPTLANALGSILRNSGAASMAKPAIAPQRAAPSAPPMPAAPTLAPTVSASQPKSTGENVASFIRAVMEGTAGVDPRSPGISAFAQGGAGAFGSRDRVAAAEEAKKIAASDRKMKLEDRELAQDDKAFDRAIKTSGEKRAVAKDKRDAKSSEITMIKTISEVMRNVDPQLDIKDRIAVERLVRDEGKRLYEAEGLQGEELKTKMQEYSRDLQGRLISKKPSITGAPASDAPPSAPAKPVAPTGDGKTQALPSRPVDQQSFDSLPSGAWFVNPADGRVLQKQ